MLGVVEEVLHHHAPAEAPADQVAVIHVERGQEQRAGRRRSPARRGWRRPAAPRCRRSRAGPGPARGTPAAGPAASRPRRRRRRCSRARARPARRRCGRRGGPGCRLAAGSAIRDQAGGEVSRAVGHRGPPRPSRRRPPTRRAHRTHHERVVVDVGDVADVQVRERRACCSHQVGRVEAAGLAQHPVAGAQEDRAGSAARRPVRPTDPRPPGRRESSRTAGSDTDDRHCGGSPTRS